jgi:hypothetical protein
MAASLGSFPSKNAWKSGENLYDRLIISTWAPKLIKLVAQAALDVPASNETSKTPAHPKRRKNYNLDSSTDAYAEQTWEQYQEFESQQEHDDRIYAQRLQDQELAARRLSALRSRREYQIMRTIDKELQNPTIKDIQCASVVHEYQDNSALHQDVSLPSSPCSKEQPDASSDLYVPLHSLGSPSSPSSAVDRLSTASSGHKIRFVFKNDLTNSLPTHPHSSNISETTSLRYQNLFEVTCPPPQPPISIRVNSD